MPKLPAKFLKDYSPDGPLYFILKTCYENRQGRRFEFQNYSKLENNLELLSRIEQKLIESGFLKYPVIYFGDGLNEEEKQELSNGIFKLRGTITKERIEATHIVVPNEPKKEEEKKSNEGEEEEEEEDDWFRTVEKGEKKALVHWWYYPDSYDEWVSTSEFLIDDPEEITPHVGAWILYKRWITDSVIFNEWTNEEDYEVENQNSQDEKSTRKQNSQKRLLSIDSNSSPQTTSRIESSPKKKRKLYELGEGSEGTPGDSPSDSIFLSQTAKKVELQPESENRPGRPKQNESEPVWGGALSNISHGNVITKTNVNVNEGGGANQNSNSNSDNNNNNGENMRKSPSASSLNSMNVDSDSINPPNENIKNDNDPNIKPPNVVEQLLSQQTEEIIIPSYSAWFDISQIHEVFFLFSIFYFFLFFFF